MLLTLPTSLSTNALHRKKFSYKLSTSKLLRKEGVGGRKKEIAAPKSFSSDINLSGLNGKAMEFPHKDEFPSRSEVLSIIPHDCFKKDTIKSLAYAVLSTVLTLFCGVLAFSFIPLKLSWWPVWISYAAVTGTVATGCWVVAHECGHNAFSENRFLQDFIGYTLHSLLLVPYFS